MSHPTRILYVDDNPHDRALVRDALQADRHSFDLIEAGNQREFEKHLSIHDFDLVLSDFNIMGFEGLQVLEAVKDKNPDIPVVIVTGTGSEEIAADAMKRGAADYVIKSVNHLQKLPTTIQNLIARQHLAIEYREAQESLQLFRILIDSSSDNVFIIEPESGLFLDFNENVISSLGYSREELKKMRVADISQYIGVEPSWNEYLTKIKKLKKMILESVHTRKDGSTFPVEINARYIQHANKQYLIAIVRDITERKLADEEVQRSLKEKKILLREIHHRVKNNLQVIIGLLKIQLNAYNRGAITSIDDVIKESCYRIKSMAVIHDQLHHSRDLSAVDIRGSINRIGNDLTNAFDMEDRVSCSTVGMPLQLGVDQAIPCVLIVNEMITNSLKHGFPEERTGTIEIKIAENRDEGVVLTISDDGVGMPSGIDWQKTDSVGLNLINGLVSQIDASIELDRTKGTRFIIKFVKNNF